MNKGMAPAKLFLWVVTAKRTLIIALLGCAVGVAACELGIPWLIQQAVDAALGYQNPSRLNTLGLLMLLVICVLYFVHCLLLRLEARVMYEGLFRLRQRIYTGLLNQPLPFFSRVRTGEVMHRVINDTDVFEDNAAEIFSDVPFELLTIAGVMTLMAITDLRLAGLVVVFLIVASVVSTYVGRSLPTLRKALQSVGASFSARLQEVLSGIRTVKVFGRERFEIGRLDEANQKFLNLDLRSARLTAFLDPVFDLMELLGVVLVVWYGAHLIIAKEITPGALVAFLAYMEILAGPVSRIDRYYGHFQQCRGVCERLAAFLSQLESVSEPTQPGLPARVPPEPWPICYDNVSFSYAGANRPAVRRLSLAIEPGEVVAIVGRNGAGKSTLMDLLFRFYDPNSGRILIAGVDLREWKLDLWREIVGMMTQEVFLFHTTIAENISYAKPNSTQAEVKASALEAGLGDLLNRLPHGIDTVVGDRGSKLSGGERQRIALARLFLKNPKIIVFDEATAHLDGEALSEWSASMARLSKGRTTLLITHQPEIARLAHRVVLIDNGEIVAEGTHGAMLATVPLYASLFSSRAREKDPRRRRPQTDVGSSPI